MRNKPMVSFEGDIPRCATERQFREWKALAYRSGHLGITNAGFCSDCTAAYQAEMVEEGRCENPQVEFSRMYGDVVGVVTVKEAA